MSLKARIGALGGALAASALLLAACSSSPAPQPIPRAPHVVPSTTEGDALHQLNQQRSATAFLTQYGAIPKVVQGHTTASDLAQLSSDLQTAFAKNLAAVDLVGSNPNAALLNAVAAQYAIAAAQKDQAAIANDLTPPPPPPTTTTTTAPPTTTTTAKPTTTTTAPSTQMAPPSGFTSSEKTLEDQFSNLNNWNTYYGPGTPWQNRGALPSPYSGGNQPGSNDEAFYGPSQDVLIPGGGVSLNATPSSQFSSQGYSVESGVLTSKNTLPSGGWYVQVKAQMPDTSGGMWPAIWALPSSSGQELDGYEGGWPGNSPNQQGHSDTFASSGEQQAVWGTPGGVDLTKGYNVYGFQFIPGTGMKFFFNGTQVYASQANLSQQNYYLFLQLQVAASQTSGWHTTGGSTTGSMRIAEVQVYS